MTDIRNFRSHHRTVEENEFTFIFKNDILTIRAPLKMKNYKEISCKYTWQNLGEIRWEATS